MSREGDVAAVLSEDSDLAMLYRCRRLLVKWDRKRGRVEETGWDRVVSGLAGSIFEKLGPFKLHQLLLDSCILAGCEYLFSIRGVALKTSVRLIEEHQGVESVRTLSTCIFLDLQSHSQTNKIFVNAQAVNYFLSLERNKEVVLPKRYFSDFQKARWTYKHQLVFSKRHGKFVHRSDPNEDSPLPEKSSFLG